MNRLLRTARLSLHWHVCWGTETETDTCQGLSVAYWGRLHRSRLVVLGFHALTYSFVAFAALGFMTLVIIAGLLL